MTISIQDLVIDPSTRTVTRGGRPLQLTPREYDLLLLLAQRADRLVTRAEICQQLYDARHASNVVDVYVSYLRRKLGEPEILHTQRGRGYLLGSTDRQTRDPE